MIAARGSARGPRSRAACAAGKASVPSGRHSMTARATATMPSTIQVARELQEATAAARPKIPANAIPMPTPEKTCPDQSSLPWAFRIGMAQPGSADQHEGTRHARQEPQRQPQRRPLRKSHQQSGEANANQAPADRKRWPRRHHDAGQCAEEIADVIAGREPAADGQRQMGVLLHQRQDRRQRKASDAHGARKRQQPDRDGGSGGDFQVSVHAASVSKSDYSMILKR